MFGSVLSSDARDIGSARLQTRGRGRGRSWEGVAMPLKIPCKVFAEEKQIDFTLV